MKKVILSIVAASVLAISASATDLYKPCVACHGANGEKPALNKSAVIKGWTVDQLVTSMKGYKDGSYGGAMKGVMKGQVAKLSDADIQALADYINKL